jgi:hypothetical protein
MTGMNIADLDAALNKVREFIGLLEQNRTALSNVRISDGVNVVGKQYGETGNLIQEKLPLILRIAMRADADLGARLRDVGSHRRHGWRYSEVLEICQQLAGLLRSSNSPWNG